MMRSAVAASACLLFCAAISASSASPQAELRTLRTDLGALVASRMGPLEPLPGLRRRERVSLDAGVIEQLAQISRAAGVDGSVPETRRIHFNLFAGGGSAISRTGIIESASLEDGGFAVSGKILEGEGGSFSLSSFEGLISGEISSQGSTFSINPHEEDGYVVEEHANAAVGQADDTVATPADAQQAPSPEEVATFNAVAREDGSRIDVLAVYTAQSAVTPGLPKIRKAVHDTERQLNEAFRESLGAGEPLLQVRMVGIEEVPNGVTTDLSQFQSSPSITALRLRYKADLVLVFHHNYNGGAGVAYVYCGNPQRSRKYAFALVRSRSLFYVKTPAHEIGHLLGAEHEPGNAGGCSSRTRNMHRAHYFRAGGTLHGTLLSYPGKRLNRFSNPNVSYLGIATGRLRRNNAKAIRESRKDIANYFVSTNGPTQPTPNPQGPIINLLQPQPEVRHRPRTAVVISAQISDSDGVGAVELFYPKTGNTLACPGSNGDDWYCSQQGSTYMWVLRIGPTVGERVFYIRAEDGRGHRSDSGRHSFYVADAPGGEPVINIREPANEAILPPGRVNIVADMTDADGIRRAELFWATTRNYLACPGGDGSTWSCSVQASQFRWSIELPTLGTRTFHFRATDRRGNTTVSPARVLRAQ